MGGILSILYFFIQSFHQVLNYKIGFPAFLALGFVFFGQSQKLFFQVVPFFLYTLNIIFQLLIVNASSLRATPPKGTFRNATVHIVIGGGHTRIARFTLILVYGIKVLLLLLNPLNISLGLGELILDLIVFTLTKSEKYSELLNKRCGFGESLA